MLCCSAGHAQSLRLESLDPVPVARLSAAAARSGLSAERTQPLRFAVAAATDLRADAGFWDEPQPGRSRWRLRIRSDGARSLSLRIAALTLPPDAELWLYGADGRDVVGPMRTHREALWTPIVRDDEAVLEARMPNASRARFKLQIQEVFHGYRAFTPRALSSLPYDPDQDTGTGAAGDCNIDTACPSGDGWRDQIRSVVLLQVGGTTLCSGTLLNNTAQDDRALVLTARHCRIGELDPVDATIAYFNVEREACGSGAEGRVDQSLRAARILARSQTGDHSDHLLLELEDRPPADFGVYYAGWNAEAMVPAAGVGIHHPSGDDKKISRFSRPAIAQTPCLGFGGCPGGGFLVDAWAVIWQQGTTEGGSSGSGLWSRQRLVGTLSGGGSRCASGTANNGGTDFYARLDTAWSKPGSENRSLQSVLDPLATGCLSLAGKDGGTRPSLDCSAAPPDAGDGSSGGGAIPIGLLLLLTGLHLLRYWLTVGAAPSGGPAASLPGIAERGRVAMRRLRRRSR